MSRNNPVYDVPEQTCLPDKSAGLIVSAERELGAFLSAVSQKCGSAAARRAADCWMEAFEAVALPLNQPWPHWRAITIAAASRMARETAVTASFAEKAS